MELTSLVGLLTLVFLFVHRYSNSKKSKLPPSPRGWPIIGNALQIGHFPWLQMTRWSEQLGIRFSVSMCNILTNFIGPIYSLNLGGQTAIVVNNYKVASDLLDKCSAIYSDRPRMIMTSEILCGNLFYPFNSHGDQ